MGNFVRHEPCPACGSRDNLARYKDGSGFCFGCNHFEARTIPIFGLEEEVDNGELQHTSKSLIQIYNAGGMEYSKQCVSWLLRYGLTVEQAIHFGWKYNSYTQEFLFPLKDSFGELICIQAKNFNPERASKAKYYNRGDKSKHATIFETNNWWRDVVVLTEDILSAVKVSSVADAMPLLGTSIQKKRLLDLFIKYDELIVWLDRDKWKEARTIADQAKLIGFKATTVLTDLDPKVFDSFEIKEYLK